MFIIYILHEHLEGLWNAAQFEGYNDISSKFLCSVLQLIPSPSSKVAVFCIETRQQACTLDNYSRVTVCLALMQAHGYLSRWCRDVDRRLMSSLYALETT